MPQPARSQSCWDLAVDLAAHHAHARADTVASGDREIFQVSTISALVDGVFTGDTPYSEIMEHGDFGVGTFNALDGEMAAVDGQFYHLREDGSVTGVDPQELTPFAAVTFFRGEAELDLAHPYLRDELLTWVDSTVPSDNLFYAIRVDGVFDSVTTRTVRRQHHPYTGLLDAAKGQAEMTFTDTSGTIVGFRAPQYAQGMTVAGYHLHFVDDDRKVGGHVLNFSIRSGTVRLDLETDLHVEMPTSPEFLDADLDGDDVSDAIEQSENVSGRS
ncbi:MAG: acetolactate decarboxylase [Actinomycetes bacterium]